MKITSFGEIDQWDPASIEAALDFCERRRGQYVSMGECLGKTISMVMMSGQSGAAADTVIEVLRRNMDAQRGLLDVARAGLSNSLNEITAVKSAVADTRTFAALHRIRVADERGGTIAIGPTGPFAAAEAAVISRNLTATAELISSTLEMANDADRDLATVLLAAAGVIPPDKANRQLNQSKAFLSVYGREPVTDAEWRIAEFLDSNTTDPHFGGMPSQVVVARIAPVPGQGVVRGSLFISNELVFDPGTPSGGPGGITSLHDYGNNRGFDKNFDPQNAKGAFIVDYENGVVIYRQNPTVDTGGNRTIGVPDVRVKQAADGTVRLDYKSPNPGSNVGPVNAPSALKKDVAGTLLITPGGQGPKVSGTIGDYPSVEVYLDRPDGTTTTLLRDEQDSTSQWGPMTELGNYHLVGVEDLPAPEVLDELNYQRFDHGGVGAAVGIGGPPALNGVQAPIPPGDAKRLVLLE